MPSKTDSYGKYRIKFTKVFHPKLMGWKTLVINLMRGRTKECTDNFSIQDIVEKEEVRADVSDELSTLKELVAVLKQYNTDLKKDENNVIKARLSYKDAVKWASEQQRKVEEVLNNVVVKFNKLNSHLSTVVRETPKYMTVNVAVSETDKSAIQAQFDANVRNMNKQHQKNMAEIRQAFDTQITKEYEHSKAHYKRIHDMLRQNDEFYVSGLCFWMCAVFFWIGVCVVWL